MAAVSSWLCAAAIAALPVRSAPALPELPASENYVVRTWEMDDGLPSNRIFTIGQTLDGYLWLGTQAGLVRFDGARFSSFSSDTTVGIQTDRVHAVFVARDGTLWLGQVNGAVARKVGDGFEPIVPPQTNPVPFELISSFAESADGDIWFAYDRTSRVSRWQNGTLSSFGPNEGLPRGFSGAVRSSRDGRIWYANSQGCAVFDGNRFQPVDPDGGGAVHLAPSRDGGMWAVREDRLLQYDSRGIRREMAELGTLSVHGLFEDSGGTLWIQTNMAGLVRFRDGQLLRVPVGGTSISAIFEDREHNLWVGRQSGGLNRVRPRQFFLRQAKDGILEDETYSVAEDGDGRLWLSGRANLLVRATDSTNRRFEVPTGWEAETSPRSIAADASGGMWIGTLNGLFHWRAGAWERVSRRPNLLSLIVDRSDAVWMASANRPLTRHQNGRDESMGPEAVRAIAQDGAGRMWAGDDYGAVLRANGSTWETIALPHGKPSGRVHAIVPDGDDTVWIAIARAGFFRWRGGTARRVPASAGFPTDDVRSMIITPDGDFWIGTGRGLYHTRRNELEAVLDGGQQSMRFRSFGRNDGVPLAEFGVGYRGSALRTRDGHIWFTTDRGALEITPHAVESDAVFGPVIVEEVTVNGAQLVPLRSGAFAVPPRPGPIEIRYTLPHLTRPEEIHFRHRLSGIGAAAWVATGTTRAASFARLPPGEYRLEVSATDAGGRPLRAGVAQVEFAIAASWWETSIFRLAVVLMGIAGLSWAVRRLVLMRVRARMRRLEQERALERERSRIARDMHDQLGASLTQIAITSKLLTLDPPDRVAAHSREIGAIARSTVDSLDEIVWAVDPANDSVAAALDYLTQFAVNFLATAGIECEMQLPESVPVSPLPALTRHQVFLAVKEALNNIVKHSGATRVTVRFVAEGRFATLHLADNGCGFNLAPARPGGSGLRNLQARMAEVGGSCLIESAPACGTRLTFTWPVLDRQKDVPHE